MHSAIYRGCVSHRRHAPRPHAFRYDLYMAYLDLDELDEVFRGRWFWSARRAALVRFDRRDHLGDPGTALQDAVRDLVADRTGERPQVRIWAEPRGRRVRLWVEDHGIGIASDQFRRIFEVFQRLHGQERYPGTGVGLALVRKGVERMGGQVGLESAPGTGSRFWIELKRGPGVP